MLKVALFWEEAFPAVDAHPPTLAGLRRALDGFDVRPVGADDLDTLSDVDLLVLPFGSAFPKPAWSALLHYLEAGGNLLNLGGVPFAVPCVREHVVWGREVRQVVYHRALRINQAFAVNGDRIHALEAPDGVPLLADVRETIRGERVFELALRFTEARDTPGEHGSAGTRDAVLTPLLYGLDAGGRRVAAPVIAIDRLRGRFAGGRWVFANVDGALPAEIIRRLAFHAALGASDLTASTSFACYYPGEQPRVTLHAGRFGTFRGRYSATVTTTDPNGAQRSHAYPPVYRGDMPAYRWMHGAASLFGSESLAPGLHTVEATLVDEDARAAAAELRIPTAAQPGVRTHRTGFWVWDERLMAGDANVTADADYFRRDGLPYPVMGTTYMGSDAHRKFLFAPNPYVWDRDFAAMREAGANLVRTGLWTGWRNVMPEPGVPDEGCLRAVDAFLLTARKYDLPVIFTFFSFFPEAWGGENPYLDPRAVSAQKDFIAAIVERYPHTPGLMWDLINEPSFCSPKRIWSTRPNYDAHERRAWQAWLSGRDLEDLREQWRLTPTQPLDLPAEADFHDRFVFQDAHPMKALDYRLFAQEMFNNWVSDLYTFIRLHTPVDQLITVGQDEGGTGDRPNPQFHARYVDFTSNHSWWRNDHLLWDSVMANTSGKPCLIEETGIMLVEEPDGRHRRSEDEMRDLLERKLALAIGGSCAGAVQWLWNSNVYMESDNEVAIGFLRADGSAKPELAPFTEMSRFLWRNRARMEGREAEPVVMVIPHSLMFSVRDLATPATQACVRTFHYANGMALRAVGEYALDGLGEPKLILLPSPRVLRQEAWEALLARAHAGATLLVTGPVESDPHWRRVERLAELGLAARTRPVAREESILLAGQRLRLRFGGEKVHKVDKAVVVGEQPAQVHVLAHGAGKVIFAPLPFELADNPEPLAQLYEFAIAESGLPRPFTIEDTDPGVLVRALFFRDSVLYTLVSEMDEEHAVRIRHGAAGTPVQAVVPAQRAVLLFVDRTSGAELDRYTPTGVA